MSMFLLLNIIFNVLWFSFFLRYIGHISSDYKIDCSFTNDDAFVISGSEDGNIYFWDLVEVCAQCNYFCDLVEVCAQCN